jgi:DNA-binding FadR family transcriptional regulator
MASQAEITRQGETPEHDFVRFPSELIFRSIRSRNLFEETVNRLGQAIKLGVVPVGERFPTEREIAERLNVSRVTVREALRALEQAGYIEILRGRHGGARVLRSDNKQSASHARKLARAMGDGLDDVLDFRNAIEPAIAALAAERHTDEQLARARELLEESRQVPPNNFRGADSRFHLALADMAGVPSLASAAADVQLRLSELLAAIPVLEESIRHSHEQHAKIIAAIGKRNERAARAAMTEHLAATADLLHGLG